jgi:hypothetical protein
VARQTLEGIIVFRNPTIGHGKHVLSGTFVGFIPCQHAMENQTFCSPFE